MLKKIGYVLTRKQKRNIVILSLIIIVGSLMELLGVSLIKPLTTVATNEAIITTDKKYILLGRILGLQTVREYVLAIVAILILIYLIKNLYLCFMYWCQYRYQYRNEERLALEVMDYYVSRDYLFHVSQNVADIQRNVASDVGSFWSAVFTITSIFNESLVCIILMIYLLVADVVSTVCVGLLVGISLIIFYFVFKKYSFRLGARFRIIAAERTKWLLQIFGGIKEIKVTEKDSFFIRKYKGTYDDYVRYQHQQSMLSSISKPIMETVCIGGLLGIVAVRVYAGVEIKTFIPTLAVFAVAAFRMLPSFNRLSAYLSQLMSYKAAVESVYSDIVKLRSEERSREKNREKTEDISETEIGIGTDICINHITFQYPSAANKVLHDLTMVVPYKKSVALIGTSGAGKTTLADVILGILIPQEGEIISGNINVLEHLSQWHKKIGYIPQTIYLMDDTIKNNIAFGVDEKDIDDERVKEVLEEAQLLEFVCELPDGVNTMVGDRGVRLSGGQRQRIGIARALYTNPQLLILDEATSALDNETETAVMEAIDSLQGSCTMIIIAHRLTTIKNCDVIYEIENGKAVPKDKKEIFGENA